MIAAISGGTCASPVTTVAAYAYDAQGARKSKTVGGTTTVTVTDPQNRALLDYDGSSGAILRWYAFGLGSNDVLSQANAAAGSRTTFIPDIQGSIVATLNSSTGALTKTGYLPYGASSATPVTFGYTAQRIDPEIDGLYYYRARHYSPAWGRFMQPDPIGYGGGENLYAYVDNDPLSGLDPSGLYGLLFSLGGTLTAGTGRTLSSDQTNVPIGGVLTAIGTLGFFVDRNNGAGTVGVSGTVAAAGYATNPNYGKPYIASAAFPQSDPSLIGAGLSKGFSLAYTTADNNSALSGVSNVTEYNFFFFQYQTSSGTDSSGNPVNTYSISPCLCVGYNNYSTQTYASPSITPGISLPSITSPVEAAEAPPQTSAGASQGAFPSK